MVLKLIIYIAADDIFIFEGFGLDQRTISIWLKFQYYDINGRVRNVSGKYALVMKADGMFFFKMVVLFFSFDEDGVLLGSAADVFEKLVQVYIQRLDNIYLYDK